MLSGTIATQTKLARVGRPRDWIAYAAAPTFAAMAVLTAAFGGGMPSCSVAQNAFSLSGMAPMYLLMSFFHAAPWLKLAASQRS